MQNSSYTFDQVVDCTLSNRFDDSTRSLAVPRTMLPFAPRLNGILALAAFAILALCNAHGQARSRPPTCYRSCNDVSITGGVGDCEAEIAYPCIQRLYASTFAGSYNGSCAQFGGPFVWKISPAGGNLLIEDIYVGGNSASCTIVVSGTPSGNADYTITVSGFNETNYPVTKAGWFSVRVGQCSGTTCPAAGPPVGTTTSEAGSVATQVQMGRYGFGKRVGSLAIHEKYPTNLLYTPSSLGFLNPVGTNTAYEMITNNAGIRQVKVPEGLANIITNSAQKYSVEIFSPFSVSALKSTNGLDTIQGAPLAVIQVENPDASGATTNRLRVTDGDGVVSDYEWKTNGWTLTQGGGLRSTYKFTTASNDLRTTTKQISGTNGLLTCNIRRFRNYGFGERLIEEIDGTGAVCLTNSYEYYTNLSLSTTGLLKQATYRNGNWESYAYDNTNMFRTNVVSGFLNQAPTTDPSLVRTMTYAHGSNAVAGAGDPGWRRATEPRCVVESVLGHEVARRYKVILRAEERDIRCVNPGAVWSDASNLVTITKWYTNDANIDRVKSIERPDGTMETYQYLFYTNTITTNDAWLKLRTNIICVGAPDGSKTSIIDGVKKIVVLGGVGQRVSRTTIDIASGLTNSHEVYSDYDDYFRPKKTTFLDGTFIWTDFGCCGYTTITNREGGVIIHHRDALNREAAVTKEGVTTTNVIDAAGRTLKTIRIGTNGTQITQANFGYDSLGNQNAMTNALNKVTQYSEVITNNQRIHTSTFPDGGTRIEAYYRDGQLASVTGTAVHPVRYEQGVEQEGGVWRRYSKEIKLDRSYADSSEWTKTYRDMIDRTYKTVYSDGSFRQSFFNTNGQLVKENDPDGITKLFAYNASGELAIMAIDMDRDGVIDFDGTDRIQGSLKSIATIGGVNVELSQSFAWATNNSAVSNLVSESRASTDGRKSWTIGYSRVTNFTQTAYPGAGYSYVTNVAPDGSSSVNLFINGRLLSATRKDKSGTQLGQDLYGYDSHGRQVSITDARNGTTFQTFDDADQVVTTTTPIPGNGQGSQTTAYTRDWQGRTTQTLLPDGTSVTNEYFLTGELRRTTGSRTYPVEYTYDAQGRRTNMTTWQNHGGGTGAAVTSWRFDANRGFLTQKLYADGQGPSYSYTPAGRLRTRTWARNVTTTYTTNAAGDTAVMSYSDGTPSVTNSFDRLGRITKVISDSSSRLMSFNDAGLLVSETNVAGPLSSVGLAQKYDEFNRRTNLVLATSTGSITNHFAFDGAGRLTNVSDGVYGAGYQYLANSPLLNQVTFRSNSTTRMTTGRQYDYLNRLLSISSTAFGASTSGVTSFSYLHNDANQRTRVALADGTYWLYAYDKLGQVTTAKRYWDDGTPVAGQQHEYAFDDIGNRTSAKAGGDAGGTGLRLASYTANSLNQYTSRDVPGSVDVLGIAHPNAGVTVNGQSAYRRGEYFWKELAVNNASAAVWQGVTNTAVATNLTNTVLGNVFLPKTAETFAYDADGNLTNDGRFRYIWDAENRLIGMESFSSAPNASKRKLVFGYDSQSRRISKAVSNWVSGAWAQLSDERFAYDGWNLLAVLNSQPSILKSFLWGLDLSGSLQGAGGVGGLLAVNGGTNGLHFACYDGNGNLTALVSGANGATMARYEYGAFGELIRASGLMAKANPFRFSTKYQDDESDFLYYGYRSYNPSVGRWLSRDPIGERRDKNIYAFVRNRPSIAIDLRGLVTWNNTPTLFSEGTTVTNWPVGTTGSVELPYDSGGATVPELSISVTCVKRCPLTPVIWGLLWRWTLDSVTINFRSHVYFPPGLTPQERSESRELEMDHVNDFSTWASSIGKPLADETESQFAGVFFLTKSGCEGRVRTAESDVLFPSLQTAIDDTIERWDYPGGPHRH